jgi:GNAT superfamily N-acetyltransferase
MTPSVRRAEPADARSIAVCLDALGYGTTAGLVHARLVAFEGSDADAAFVAIGNDGTSPLGVVSVHLLPLFHSEGNLARITALAVRDDAQRTGVGRMLVDAAETFAWARACRRIEVTSGDHRPNAHAFYLAMGYALDERRFLKHAQPRKGGSP